MKNYEVTKKNTMDKLVIKMVDWFYKADSYEGDQLDISFFKKTFDLSLQEAEVDEIKSMLSSYIYHWYDENKDREIGSPNVLSIKTTLSKYIGLLYKGQLSSKSELSLLEKELEKNMDLIICLRYGNNIPLDKEFIPIKLLNDKSLNISYRPISRAFHDVTLYMLKKDSKFLEGLKQAISPMISMGNEEEKETEIVEHDVSTPVEDSQKNIENSNDSIVMEDQNGKKLQRAFFFRSNISNVITAGFFYGGVDKRLAFADEALTTLKKYVSQCQYKTIDDIMGDPNIQFQSDIDLEKFVQEYSIFSKVDNATMNSELSAPNVTGESLSGLEIFQDIASLNEPVSLSGMNEGSFASEVGDYIDVDQDEDIASTITFIQDAIKEDQAVETSSTIPSNFQEVDGSYEIPEYQENCHAKTKK